MKVYEPKKGFMKKTIFTSCKFPFQIRSFRDDCVGVGHHGDQHVEQHDDVAHRVTAEHQQAPKSVTHYMPGIA
jgi:hypothetical protein